MFTASDGIQIDIRENPAPVQKAILVLWPCMTGNTDMYRLPVGDFNIAGISVVQFNPRGHAGSGGQFDLTRCIDDLNEYLESLHIKDIPLWFVGHSAGASAVLKYGTFYKLSYRYILVSPVLDSIESYKYLYMNQHQPEINTLISSLTSNKEFMHKLLENNEWMKHEVWEKKFCRIKINAISGNLLIGSLMEKLFIEGYNAFQDLKLHREKTTILLPVSDNWYPMTVTSELAAQNGINLETIIEAKDHYFTGAWKYVWQRILEYMRLQNDTYFKSSTDITVAP